MGFVFVNSLHKDEKNIVLSTEPKIIVCFNDWHNREQDAFYVIENPLKNEMTKHFICEEIINAGFEAFGDHIFIENINPINKNKYFKKFIFIISTGS